MGGRGGNIAGTGVHCAFKRPGPALLAQCTLGDVVPHQRASRSGCGDAGGSWTTSPSRLRGRHSGDRRERRRGGRARPWRRSGASSSSPASAAAACPPSSEASGGAGARPLPSAGRGVPALSAAGLSLGRAGGPPAEGRPGPAPPPAPPGRGGPLGPPGQRRGHPQRLAGGGRAPQRPGGLHGEGLSPGWRGRGGGERGDRPLTAECPLLCPPRW